MSCTLKITPPLTVFETPWNRSSAKVQVDLLSSLLRPNFLLLSNRIIIFILESVCPTRIPVASRDEKGFELMVGMNIEKKGKKINGSLVSETAFALTTSTDITEDTRYHPVERV